MAYMGLQISPLLPLQRSATVICAFLTAIYYSLEAGADTQSVWVLLERLNPQIGECHALCAAQAITNSTGTVIVDSIVDNSWALESLS
jgi:hypothetical protein